MTGVATLYVYALAVGFAAAGVTGSVWNLVTGENPRLKFREQSTVFTPIGAIAAVVNAPLAIFWTGLWKAFANPVLGLLLIAASLGWSFLQGVFILTTVFGLK